MNIAKIKFNAPIIKENSFHAQPMGEHHCTMELHLNDSDHRKGWIEFDIPAIDEFAEIGLWFEDDRKTLSDYDGVFALPSEAIQLLRDNGYIVGDQFE
jgi:hypothetical protein